MLQLDDKLPSVCDLAKRKNVNANTVKHAYKVLKEEGYLYKKQEMGSLVIEDVGNKNEGV